MDTTFSVTTKVVYRNVRVDLSRVVQFARPVAVNVRHAVPRVSVRVVHRIPISLTEHVSILVLMRTTPTPHLINVQNVPIIAPLAIIQHTVPLAKPTINYNPTLPALLNAHPIKYR
jgi:hypothetical protein